MTKTIQIANVIGFTLLALWASAVARGADPAGTTTATTSPTTATAVRHAFACTDNGGSKVCLVSAEGKIEWQYPAAAPQDVWLLANGNILFAESKAVREVTPDKKVVWEYTTPAPNEIHSCQPLPGGVVLIGELGPCRLIEVDRQGKIQKEIKLQTKADSIHLQFRLARKTPQDTYLVAFTGEAAVRELDGQGKTLRTIPAGLLVYGAIRLPGGNTLIATGDGHRIIEVDPKDKIVWEVKENDLPGNPLRFVAGLQRLPNGNTVVCNWGGHGHVGEQPQIFEVTPDKRVVWQINDWQQFNTISNISLRDTPGDPVRGELYR